MGAWSSEARERVRKLRAARTTAINPNLEAFTQYIIWAYANHTPERARELAPLVQRALPAPMNN
jgi:hypothetical protein